MGAIPELFLRMVSFYALQENDIPCGKSDPLNVAKNINRLNEDWAMGKRPAKAALAAVGFLRLILEADDRKRERLIDYFFFRLSLFVLLSKSDVEEVLERTTEFIENVNTSLRTKNGWNEIFEDL